MTITMDMTELIFKDVSKLLIRYDSNRNIPILDGFHDYYVTEVVGSLYKFITGPTNLNLNC